MSKEIDDFQVWLKFDRAWREAEEKPKANLAAAGYKLPQVEPYRQVRPELAQEGILYDANGAQIGVRLANKANRRVLPPMNDGPSDWDPFAT